jgi:hypothetical protein
MVKELTFIIVTCPIEFPHHHPEPWTSRAVVPLCCIGIVTHIQSADYKFGSQVAICSNGA